MTCNKGPHQRLFTMTRASCPLSHQCRHQICSCFDEVASIRLTWRGMSKADIGSGHSRYRRVYSFDRSAAIGTVYMIRFCPLRTQVQPVHSSRQWLTERRMCESDCTEYTHTVRSRTRRTACRLKISERREFAGAEFSRTAH